ncbi:MAG: ribonuclease VapC [Methanobrevibacter wolinii]|uniref:ribonuclease VapC n=1 Tax=Methanobrevibacter wolinii TaxID=190977 RepID=UPI0005B2BAA0|nr:ribonuclease VapC [Methanobrevibacter wolinii]MDD5959186.1 ribonuclease VapC [Methanobrevibacter wolinii]
MVKKYNILDASAFIGGFEPKNNLNFTVPEITYEVKDLKSKILLDQCIDQGKIVIKSPEDKYLNELDNIISESGDDLRLSYPDKQLLALALEIQDKKGNICVYTDDYSIQNVLKIINLPFSSIITEGIHEVYNWIKTCEGCKKEYPSDYPEDVCEICGSKIFKRRIKN